MPLAAPLFLRLASLECLGLRPLSVRFCFGMVLCTVRARCALYVLQSQTLRGPQG
jgi:hypothetical protein